jgi:hypothetical protein
LRKHKQRIGRKEGKTGKKSMRKGGNKKDADKEQEEEWTLICAACIASILQGQGFVFGTVVGGLRIVENKGNKQEKDKRKINDKIGKDEAKVKNGKTESKKRKR